MAELRKEWLVVLNKWYNGEEDNPHTLALHLQELADKEKAEAGVGDESRQADEYIRRLVALFMSGGSIDEAKRLIGDCNDYLRRKK